VKRRPGEKRLVGWLVGWLVGRSEGRGGEEEVEKETGLVGKLAEEEGMDEWLGEMM